MGDTDGVKVLDWADEHLDQAPADFGWESALLRNIVEQLATFSEFEIKDGPNSLVLAWQFDLGLQIVPNNINQMLVVEFF